MSMRRQQLIGLAFGLVLLGTGNLLRAQEGRQFSPDLEQLRESISERLQAVGDKLGLTDVQRNKIREAHQGFAEKYQALRSQRRELLNSELEALGHVLTPDQREIAKGYVEDIKSAATGHDGPMVGPIAETLADRLHGIVDKLNLTPEQWTKIRQAHAPFAEKYRAQRAERHKLVQEELQAASEVLTPEQREKVKNYIEARTVHSPVVQSVAERLRAAADHLGISTEQRTKIREAHRGFTEQYHALNDQREQLLQEELKAVGTILTPEQREKVSNFFADRVVMVGGDLSRLDEGQITELRETVAQRLEGAADRIGLTGEQKEKIKETHAGFIPKYRAQRDQRRELRQKELDALSALLTADQRDKIKDFIGDEFAAPKAN
jgi:Spy/CpxP family protein refolding chaperone